MWGKVWRCLDVHQVRIVLLTISTKSTNVFELRAEVAHHVEETTAAIEGASCVEGQGNHCVDMSG